MSGNANLLRRRRTATSGAPNAEGGSTLAISAPWLITPGRYRAVVWAERLPASEQTVEIGAGQTRALDWVIGAPG